MPGKRVALLISTSTYENQAFRQLKSPAADVAALSGILQDPAVGGYEVQLLSDVPSWEVNQAVDRLFASARRDDSVLLYFSGHGFRDDGNRLYMVTRDSYMVPGDSHSTLLGSTAVSAQFVRDQLERCRSRRKIVILDCCYAGAFPADGTKDAGKVDVISEFGGRGSVVITASSALQYSFESDSDEAVSELDTEAKPSIFTSALIEGIVTGSADLNGDGVIDIDELYTHVHDQVTLKVPQQTPQKKSDVEGTLFVALSPRGARPAKLPPEIIDSIHSPLAYVRRAAIESLVNLCSRAHRGVVLAVQNALYELTEDDSNSVAKTARDALAQIAQFVGEVTSPTADGISPHSHADQEIHDAIRDMIAKARQEADAIIATARREADEQTSAVEGGMARLRAVTDQEVAQLRGVADHEVAEKRASTEREVAQLKAAAKRERDEILTTSKRQADEMRSQAQRILDESEALLSEDSAKQRRYEILSTAQREVAQLRAVADHEIAVKRAATERDIAKLRTVTEREVLQHRAAAKRERDEILTTSKRQADEMRSQAMRILEESEAQRAQAEAEFEIQLAARREEAERQEAERLAAAQAATQRLVNEAERRALTAEQRAVDASAQADRTRREINELVRQKDNIATHLAQVRQLLGDQFGMNLPELDPPPGSAEATVPIDGTARRPAGEPPPDGHGKHANRMRDFWTK
jgi:Caspase domain